MALELGSDCPFFILNQPCLATGRGEIMEPLAISLKGYQLVLLNMGIHINTGWAFRQIEPNDSRPGFESISETPLSQWQQLLSNDFEPPVFREHPVLQELKDHLLKHGATMAAMTGSGSTLFGIFPEDSFLPSFEQWPGIWVKQVKLEA
jgi:4-diphosphocytidyl-2-C-methyl-D-erythritol kinase